MRKITLLLMLLCNWSIFSQSNDICSSATVLSCGTTLTAETTNGATGGSSSSCIGTIGNDVWYQFSGNGNLIQVLANSVAEEPQVEVFESTDGTCNGINLSSCFASGGTGSNSVQVEFVSAAGSEYFVRVGNYINGDPDFDFDINLSCITCIEPENLVENIISTTSVDFSWDQESTATAGYNWVVMASGDDPIVDTPVASGSTPSGTTTAQATGLSDSTSYDIYVQSDCGGGDLSTWTGPLSVVTDCTAFTAPYVEDFEAAAGSTPNCWAESGGESWDYDNSAPSSGHIGDGGTLVGSTASGGYFAWIDDSGSQAPSTLTSPLIDISALTTPSLKFYWVSYDEEQGLNATLDVEVNDGTNWVLLNSLSRNTGSTPGEWVQEVLDLSSYSGTIQVRFTITDSGDFYDDIAIDDIAVENGPTCYEPLNVTVTSITATDATFTWNGNASSYNVEIVTAGTAPTGTPTASGVSSPYTTSNLMSNTDYGFYLQSDCGGGDLSTWSGPYGFTTACGVFNLPVCENFDTTPTGTSSSPNTPNCWSFIDSGLGYGYVSTTNDKSAPNSFYMYNSSDSSGDYILISPEINNVSNGNSRIDFWVDGSSGQDLIIGTMSDAADANTFTAIQTVTLATSSLENYTINIPSGTDSYVALKHGQTGTFDGYYFDDICIEAIPSCLAPDNLMASNITTTTADLAWTENGTTAIWNVEVVTAGSTPTGTPSASGVSNPYSATSLMSGTDYEFYVQADCGGSTSTWAGPFAFTTVCAAYVAPYSENFDAAVGSIPNCWSSSSSSSTDWEFDDSPTFGNSYSDNTTGSGYFAFVDSSTSTTTTDATLFSPMIDVSTLTTPMLEFYVYHFNNGGASNSIAVEVWDGTTWNQVYTDLNGDVDGWERIQINLSTLTITGDIQVRFIVDTNVGSNYENDIAIDDVSFEEFPTCPDPSSLMASNITDTSAELNWTENGTATVWNVEVITAGSTPTGTPTTSGVSNPYTATGLMATTDYEFYVQADCGGGDLSNWIGPISFTTLCSTFTAPYLEDFEAAAGSTPNCWAESGGESWDYDNSAPSSGHIGDGGTLVGSTASGGYFAWIDDSGSQAPSTLTSPLIDISALTTPSLKFYWVSYDEEQGLNATLDVEVNDGTNWVLLNSLSRNTGSTPGEWVQEVLDLSSYSGTIQVRFTITDSGDFYDDIAIDDIAVENGPTCYEPLNVTVTSITATDATFTWNGNASSYNVEIVTAGTAPTGTPTASGVSSPYTASNLISITDYEFYIQSDCGGSDFSTWAGPFSFTTECGVYTAPYTQDFNGSDFVPECWQNAGSGTPLTGPSSFGLSSWTDDNYLNDTNNTTAARVNLYAASKEEWLISPEIDLSTGIFNLEFLVGETDFANSGANEDGGMSTTDDEVQVLITTDGGTTWQNITTYSAANTPALTGQLESFSLAAYSGVVQIAFWASEGTVNDAADYDFFIDDVAIVVAPCEDPSNITVTNITETAADISWTENGSATEWEVIYGLPGFDPNTAGTTIVDNDGTIGVLLTGLTEGQDYDVYVRANCSTGFDSDWSLVGNFTTVCPAVSNVLVSNETETTADIFWTENGSATEWEILYGPVNFDPNTAGTSVLDNDGTLGETLTGLTEGEDYDVYVRAICSSVDSAWVGPETFSTDELGVENHLLDGIKLYPNPVKNVLNFESTNQIDNISVYNLLGERILDVRPKNLNTRISLESLQAGVYLVKAQKGSAMKVFKIVKE